MTGWSVYDEEPTPEPYSEEILDSGISSIAGALWNSALADPLRDMVRAAMAAQSEYQRRLAMLPAQRWPVPLLPVCKCNRCTECYRRSVNQLLAHYRRSGYEWATTIPTDFVFKPDMSAIHAKYKGPPPVKPPSPGTFNI